MPSETHTVNKDKEFLELIVKALVEHPEDVAIDRTIDEMGVLLRLSVNQADMGRVIGREGTTASAIRTILKVFGMRYSSKVHIKINDPQ